MLELPGGIGLRVEVGNLLELQGPLHTGGIVHIPANEKHIVVPVVLLSQGGEIGVEVNGPLNKARELKNGLHQFLVPLIIQFAQAASQINRQHVQHRHLGGVALGGGHRDLRPGPSVNDMVGQLGDGAAHHVDNGQDAGPPGLALLHGGDGVRGLPGLGDHHQQGVLIHQGIAVAKLGGQVRLHGNPAELLHHILAHAAGIEGRAAGGNHNLVDLPQVFVRQGEVVQHHLSILNPGLNGGLDGVGLLHDLLEHKVVITTLFRRCNIPSDPGDRLFEVLTNAVVYGNSIGSNVRDLPVF